MVVWLPDNSSMSHVAKVAIAVNEAAMVADRGRMRSD